MQTKTLRIKHLIQIRPFKLQGFNKATREIKKEFQKIPNTGNCLENSIILKKKLDVLKIPSRIVYGFANPNRGDFSTGAIGQLRHAWLEVLISEIGWIPIDTDSQYFAELPLGSHIIESYDNSPLTIKFTGGYLTASSEYYIISVNSD